MKVGKTDQKTHLLFIFTNLFLYLLGKTGSTAFIMIVQLCLLGAHLQLVLTIPKYHVFVQLKSTCILEAILI